MLMTLPRLASVCLRGETRKLYLPHTHLLTLRLRSLDHVARSYVHGEKDVLVNNR
jgi:hypothetical protein